MGMDDHITGKWGQSQFEDYHCECCDEKYDERDLIELTNGKLYCEYCIDRENLNPCYKCDRPIAWGHDAQDELCQSCCESMGDYDID